MKSGACQVSGASFFGRLATGAVGTKSRSFEVCLEAILKLVEGAIAAEKKVVYRWVRYKQWVP